MPLRLKAFATTALVALVLAAPFPARAADPAKVDRLVKLLKVDQQLGLMENALVKGFETGFADAARKKGASDAEIERARAIVVPAVRKAFDEALGWNYLKPQIEKIYADQFSDAEVDAAIAYYGSPMGQSLLSKMPAVAQQASQIGIARAREMGPKVDAIINDALKQVGTSQQKK
ncbi:MAG TPA: DUF2059 domain-containing protein [Xanthomonadaceae bacterium]|jgi:hypothetical protein